MHNFDNDLKGPPTSTGLPVCANAERLAYYRSHGLACCDDYPGGDARFEADVLSGAEYDRLDRDGKEDLYIAARMDDGRFTYDGSLFMYITSRVVAEAFDRNYEKWAMNNRTYEACPMLLKERRISHSR